MKTKRKKKITPLYNVMTYDAENEIYTPEASMKSQGITIWEVKRVLQSLRKIGYEASYSSKNEGGCDPSIVVERVEVPRKKHEVL